MEKKYIDARNVEISKCIKHNTSLEWVFDITEQDLKDDRYRTRRDAFIYEAKRLRELAQWAAKNADIYETWWRASSGLPDKPKQTKGQLTLF